MKKLKARYRRWLRFHRLRKVPRRTYIISTTHQRAAFVADYVGTSLRERTTVFVDSPRRIEGMRFLPGDKIVAAGPWPEHVLDVVMHGLHSSDVGVKTKDLLVFEVIS